MIIKQEIEWIDSTLRHKLVKKEDSNYYEPPFYYKYWFNDRLAYLSHFNHFIDSLINTRAKRDFYNEITDNKSMSFS